MAVVGTFIAILATIVINPLLHHYGILQTWQPGMDTVNTTFSNTRDFWLSFGIGSGVGIAVVSIVSLVRDLRGKFEEIRQINAKESPTMSGHRRRRAAGIIRYGLRWPFMPPLAPPSFCS